MTNVGSLPNQICNLAESSFLGFLTGGSEKPQQGLDQNHPEPEFKKNENVIGEIPFENRVGSRSRFCYVLVMF